MNFSLLAAHAMVLMLFGACTQVTSSIVAPSTSVGAPVKPVVSSPTPAKPVVSVPKTVPAPSVTRQPEKPASDQKTPDSNPVTSSPATSGQAASAPIKATDVDLNHFCLLSDHTNLCSRTNMQPDPGHSLKLEPMNGTGQTLTGTLVIEFDASKIEPAVDGHLRHSVKRTTTAFEKSSGKLTIRNFVVQPGKDYQYLWDRVKPNVSGMVTGKATFSWKQDQQTKYAMGCYEFNLDAVGGNDNILGLEKSKFNGYGSMDCGAPSIPE
jgi:hypothetical protein